MSFRDLHYAEEPLLLPNAWDVSSALAFYDAGYPAIGTTSFGLATPPQVRPIRLPGAPIRIGRATRGALMDPEFVGGLCIGFAGLVRGEPHRV